MRFHNATDHLNVAAVAVNDWTSSLEAQRVLPAVLVTELKGACVTAIVRITALLGARAEPLNRSRRPVTPW